MRKKRVLFVASVFDHLYTFHQPYFKWFQENGFEVHIACENAEKISNVDVATEIPFGRKTLTKNHFISYKKIKEYVEREHFDLITCHTPIASVITRFAARDARKKGTKIMYTAHGFHFYEGSPLINWLIYYPIERIGTYFSDAVVTINTEDYELISKQGDPKCLYFKIPGIGVDSQIYFPVNQLDKINLRKQRGFSEGKKIFIYAARFAKDKNHEFIINAVRNHPTVFENSQILFAGNENLEESLKILVKKYHLEEKIIFLGYQKEIHNIYKMCDFGLSSSVREGLGLNLIEEMMCGLPVVATEQRGHKEIVDSQKNGYLFPIDDENKFIECCQKILSPDFDYAYFSQNAVEKSRKFELKNSLQKMTEIYKKLL